MTTLREAAQMALDVLGPTAPDCCGCRYEWQSAIDALSAALSAPDNKPLTKDETMLLANETAGNHWGNEAHLQRFRSAIEGRHGIHSESATNSASSVLV